MNRFFTVTMTVAVALVCLAGVGAIAATAQEDANETATEAQNETEILSEQAEPGEYLQEVDNRTRITGWSYDGQRFEIEFEADRRTRVTLTEAVQFEEGVGQGSIRQHRIPSGQSTISINVDPIGGEAAVSITTAKSTNEGRFTFISTGQTDQAHWFDGGATWGLVYTASTATFLGVAIGARHYKRKQETDDDDYRVEDL